MATIKRTPYLTNKDLMREIHKSKNSYCSFLTTDDHQYDLILPKHEDGKNFLNCPKGCKRGVCELKEKNKTLFEAGRRIAINSPVQGTQADIMKLAMIRIDEQLISKKYEARMILQIHDEIILELPHDELEHVQKIVQKTMESIVDWEVPLNVSISTGKNWGEVSK